VFNGQGSFSFYCVVFSVGRGVFELEIQFHRDFHNGEMNTVYSFLDQNYSKVPTGEGADSMTWQLNGSGNFDIRS